MSSSLFVAITPPTLSTAAKSSTRAPVALEACQPAGSTGEPTAYFDDFSGSTPSINQVPCTFAFDLNTGTVTLDGAFPGLPPSLHFTVDFLKGFDGAGGENRVFCSKSSSDDAGYVLAVQLVAAS
jgi:hypothetical protein